MYTKGAKTFGVGFRGQTTTHVKIFSSLGDPPPSIGNIEGPYLGA